MPQDNGLTLQEGTLAVKESNLGRRKDWSQIPTKALEDLGNNTHFQWALVAKGREWRKGLGLRVE